MKTLQIVQSTISILAVLTQLQTSTASPLDNSPRSSCTNSCGYYGQLCCTSSQTCSTDSNNEAVCIDSSGGSSEGTWEYHTTTYVTSGYDTMTITSTWSSYVATQTSSTCNAEIGETLCGSTCCGAAYVCANDQCIVGSSSILATGTGSPAVLPTSQSTVTETAAVTTTQGFIAPVGTNGASLVGIQAEGGGGLSGGAIAGIVIGTIAGVFFLLLFCACMCCRGALDALFGCLGLGRRRRTDTTYVEERISHHASGSRPEGRTWFGARPNTSEVSEKKSWWSSLATIGIILGAIALCLGLRRHGDRDEKSEYTATGSYTYSYYSSESSASSDGRTRDERQSRRSRTRSRRS